MRISDWSSDVCSSDLKAVLDGAESHRVDGTVVVHNLEFDVAAFELIDRGGSAGTKNESRLWPALSVGPELFDFDDEARRDIAREERFVKKRCVLLTRFGCLDRKSVV